MYRCCQIQKINHVMNSMLTAFTLAIVGVGIIFISDYAQATRLDALNAKLDSIALGTMAANSGALPAVNFSHPEQTEATALNAILMRQIVRDEIRPLAQTLARLEALWRDAALQAPDNPSRKIATGVHQASAEEMQDVRDVVHRGLRTLSRHSDPFSPEHSRLVSNIMRLPDEERGAAMRQLNQRMNQ